MLEMPSSLSLHTQGTALLDFLKTSAEQQTAEGASF